MVGRELAVGNADGTTGFLRKTPVIKQPMHKGLGTGE